MALPVRCRLDAARVCQNHSTTNRPQSLHIESDPGNRLKGFDVLGKVSESLDCLFLHSRENPALCKRGDTSSSIRE